MFKTMILWLILVSVSLGFYWKSEGYYILNPGLYLSIEYRGVHVSDLIYSQRSYALLNTFVLHVGAVAMLPGLILSKRKIRQRDVQGNIITPSDWKLIMDNYRKVTGRKHWPVSSDRNKIFLGVDLLTLEDVFMEGEDIFQGTMIIGQQGIGKTSRFFKSMLAQLVDPKTSFCVFSLKSTDSTDIKSFLTTLGCTITPWSMGNIVQLALDKNGSYSQSRLAALLQSTGWASDLGSEREPFWLDTSMVHIAQILLDEIAKGKDPTLGTAFRTFEKWVQTQTRDDRMYQGLLETLRSSLSPMSLPADRVAVLYSQTGGLHMGTLHARAGDVVELTSAGPMTHHLDKPTTLPYALYMLDPAIRRPFSWPGLLEPTTSIILPPAGSSKADRFALNYIKSSLFSWISDDMASANPLLLRRDPQDRHRIVLALDEAHNFVAFKGTFSDARALAEFRESGLVYIGATQSMAQLQRGEQAKHFTSLIGTYLFLRVSGSETAKIIDFVGKIGVQKIRRTYGLSETDSVKGISKKGNVSESVDRTSESFIPEDLYRKFLPGMAITIQPGRDHKVIYCPYHSQLEVRP